MMKNNIKAICAIVILLVIVFGFAFVFKNLKGDAEQGKAQNEKPKEIVGGEYVGRMVCLPHRNASGPQTLECAFGLLAEDGNYYALKDTDPNYKNVSGISTDTPIRVTGTFTPKEDSKYKSIGIIEVVKIESADAPKRINLVGVYLCLPHKNTSGPQTDECAFGIKTDEGKYYGLDFSLSSKLISGLKASDRISADGVFVPLERLNTDIWQKYPIEGIFSVTNSFKILK
jgi:hypothetical protein